jgi:hypothetical protein
MSRRGGRAMHRLLDSETVSDHAKEECGDQHCSNDCEHSGGIHGHFLE